MLVANFYKWLCSFTIVKWTKGKFKTFTAYLRFTAKHELIVWLILFIFIGITVNEATDLIQAHTTVSMMVSLFLGLLLGHLFWK